MKCPTQIEQDLFDYLSPEGRVEVEEHLAALEAEPPNECPNCGAAIADADSFCDDDCKDAWWGIDKMQIKREKTEAQREDAGEHRQELIRMDADRLRDEAIELMIRPDPVLDENEDGAPGERLARDGYQMLEPYDYKNDR